MEAVEAVKEIEGIKSDQKVLGMARVIAGTIQECLDNEAGLHGDERAFASGYVRGLENALSTVCLLSGCSVLQEAARRYFDGQEG